MAALAQLCAFNHGQGQGLEAQSVEFIDIPFNRDNLKYSCNIKSRGDLWKIFGISLNSNLDKNTICNKFKSFSIIVGGVVIIELEYPIFNSICTVEKNNDSYLCKLNLEPFISTIQYLGLQDVKVELQLNNIEDINDVRLILENTYLDTDVRHQSYNANHEYDIQQIYGHMLKFSERNTLIVKLNFELLSKGYFITGDIDSIENIVLKLNHYVRFSYNKLVLRVIGNRIANNVLYIPFNRDYNWNDIRHVSFTGGLNQSRFDDMKMEIQFNIPTTEIGIYTLVTNTFQTFDDLGGLCYSGSLDNDVLCTL
jgi:hypothetical protein